MRLLISDFDKLFSLKSFVNNIHFGLSLKIKNIKLDKKFIKDDSMCMIDTNIKMKII